MTDIASFNSTELTFSTEWAIVSPSTAGCCTDFIYEASDGNQFIHIQGTEEFDNLSPDFLTASATPVPFGVDSRSGVLLLGSLYGVSRIRKTIAARKQINNQEA